MQAYSRALRSLLSSARTADPEIRSGRTAQYRSYPQVIAPAAVATPQSSTLGALKRRHLTHESYSALLEKGGLTELSKTIELGFEEC